MIISDMTQAEEKRRLFAARLQQRVDDNKFQRSIRHKDNRTLQRQVDANRQTSQAADTNKANQAKLRRKGVMLDRWRTLQQRLDTTGDVVKAMRGAVYSVAEQTLPGHGMPAVP